MCPRTLKESEGKQRLVPRWAWVWTHSWAHMRKRWGRRSTGSAPFCDTGILSPTVFLLWETRFALLFFQTPGLSPLPNAASGHCQDLDTLGSIPKQVCWGAEGKSSMTRWPFCFARQVVYFCILVDAELLLHLGESQSGTVGCLP